MSSLRRFDPTMGRLLRLPLLRWLSVAALGFLSGCGTYGDFDRLRPSLVYDDIHAWMGPVAAPGPATKIVWRHQLTDEERTLRDLAYPLIEPPYDRNTWCRRDRCRNARRSGGLPWQASP